jgi:hypothetical protein
MISCFVHVINRVLQSYWKRAESKSTKW